MKSMIRQYIRNFINESFPSEHYEIRVYKRLIDPNEITVGYEIPNTYGEYIEVGKYILPIELKSKIVENSKLVENYNFPKNKSYAVKISDIPIDYGKIIYLSENEKNFVLKNKPTILFLDKATNSNGNQLYAVIRDNIIVTAFFGKSYSMGDIKEKMRVDVFVKNIDLIKNKKIY